MSFTADFIAAATANIRRPKALIEVTWGSSDEDKNRVITSNDLNRIDRTGQLFNGETTSGQKWAHLDSTIIADGSFHPMPTSDTGPQMGWFGNFVSNGSGEFTTDPYIQIAHDARNYETITVIGDSVYNQYPVDFTITFTHSGGPTNIVVTGNTQRIYETEFATVTDVTAVRLTVSKWSATSAVVKIIQFAGYSITFYDSSDITELSILEETNSDTGAVAVGNVSANELDLSLLNTDRRFSYGNTDSPYVNSLVSARKVRAWLGFVLPSGSADATGDVTGYRVRTENGDQVGYMPYGVYWSKDWISKYDSMETNVFCYDVAYRLDQENFTKSGNYSGDVPTIIDSVMTQALESIPELVWSVHSDLTGETWGNVYFEEKSYLDTLKDICTATLSYAYVDRTGTLIIGDKLYAAVSVPSYQELDQSDYFNFESQPRLDELINTIRVSYTEYSLHVSDTIYPDDKEFAIPAGESSLSLFVEFDNAPVLVSSVSVAVVQVSGATSLASSSIYAGGADLVISGTAGSVFTLTITGQWYELEENAKTTAEDTESVESYGVREFALSGNVLITSESQAQAIASALLSNYGSLRQDASMSWPASSLVAVGDTLKVTEFKSDTVETIGSFIIKRQNLKFNGALDSETALRRG